MTDKEQHDDGEEILAMHVTQVERLSLGMRGLGVK